MFLILDLTVLILTKNEESNISKCIDSFRGIAKKFVIIDSFSVDKTEEICRLKSKEVELDFYQREFDNHAEQFNWGLNNTGIDSNWIMRIDADEELTVELANELVNILPEIGDEISGIYLNRRIYFMGKWIKYGGVYPLKVLRIFKRGKGYCENRMMDEHIVLNEGRSIDLNKDFIDNNKKDLEWWINKHNWYSGREMIDYLEVENHINRSVKPRVLGSQEERKRWLKLNFYYRVPLMRRAMLFFIYRYFIRLGFMDGKEGLIYHFLQGYWYRFLVDAKIYEYKKDEHLLK
ncbi:glycosyltransferase family 2 protein [Bacillus gobiensis]|uniref:glycosyltransferase family 2 protein n=1 Tax=Bacillus gobiensis TaxID=1441095 RepID=UPI003D1BF995